ncbi:AMP-binding protein [SAR92 clade bacterium H246]
MKQNTISNDTQISELHRVFDVSGLTVISQLASHRNREGAAECVFYGESGRMLSYSEFDAITNRLANGFKALGLVKGDRLSVLSKNMLANTLAMVAAWKLGVVYCPICNHYKGDLLAYILDDTAPAVLLADQNFISELNSICDQLESVPKLIIYQPEVSDHDYSEGYQAQPFYNFESHLWCDSLSYPECPIDVDIGADDIANIIYTSGTTGNPKGVIQTHQWMHNYCYVNIQRAALNPEEKMIIYNDLPLYHVGGAVFNIVSALWTGNQVALWDKFSASDFWSRIRSSGATHAIFIDVMVDWLMKASPDPTDTNNDLSIVSMTPLPQNCISVAKRFGIDFVISGYGSTELGVGFYGLIDVFPEQQDKPWKERIRHHQRHVAPQALLTAEDTIKKGFMGVPSPLMKVRVVDENGETQKANHLGRVIFKPKIEGILFKEYLNKPAATSDAFQNGWYHSPDIVRYDEHGVYYFEDRMQGFIRVRGENVSATAVESQLNRHSAIERSVVVSVPAVEGSEEEIVAFVILENNSEISENDIKKWCQRELPKFMQPSYIRLLKSFPVTKTFKIQKYRLKETIIKELGR